MSNDDTEPLDALRGLREALQAVARRHPHLIDPGARPGGQDAWERTLESVMGDEKTKVRGYRLPESLIDRVDEHAAAFERRTGARLSQGDTVRRLLELALEISDRVSAAKDPLLPPDPPVILDLVAFALDGVQEARRRAGGQTAGG